MKYYRLLFVAVFLMVVSLLGVSSIVAQGRVFTLEELAQYDGKDGHQAYYAYEGVVYDVTDSPLWKLGEHFGYHAGKDLTGQLEGAPHGDGVVKAMPVVGTLQSATVLSANPVTATSDTNSEPTQSAQAWYLSPLHILGLSVVVWSGILLAIVFILTLASYFAVIRNRTSLFWNRIHQSFAWITVILGVIFGVLSVMQLFGWYL